jgi:glycosyltransferase involved in cell wall biosynthesis
MGTFRTGRFLLKQFVKRNTEYRKTTSSGRDLVVYCDHTQHQWNPELFKTKGFGGSEEAVIYLTRELAKLGWDITVYNNCGHKPLVDGGVTYRPSWDFNPRDKQDIVVLWRVAKPLDWDINAEKILVDLHDAASEKAFTDRNRLAKVTGVFVKSQFHRSLYPNVPDRKVAIIPNGLDFSLLQSDEPKDPHLLINTSSADRSLDVLPKLFKQVKRRVPKARLQWAYGWDLFALFNANHPEKMQWMERTRREMEEAGIETLGHLTQAEVGKLYCKAAILAYPTEFPEIDCISARKAQACGCVPVTSDFGALAESVQFGIKVPCVKRNIGNQDGRFHLGIENVEAQRLWVDVTVDLLTNPAKRSELAVQGASWARQFGWPQIAARWHDILSGQGHFAATP